MKSKSGQAALEFLTTYGWMLLIVVVIFGALASFGILSPSNYIKSSCKLDGKLECPVFSLKANETTGQVQLDFLVQNNAGDRITITNMSLAERDADSTCISYDVVPLSGSLVLASQGPEKEQDIRFEFLDGQNCVVADAGLDSIVERKVRYDVKIYYTLGESTLQSVSAGSMVTEAGELS